MEQTQPIISKPRKARKWIKRAIILVVVLAIAVFLLKACMGGGAGATAGTYLPDCAAYQDMTVYVSGTGTIEPAHSHRVTTLIQGEILEAPFEEGQQVQKGDLLFRLDASDVETSIRQAELALQQYQLNLQQAQRNYEQLLKNQSDNQKDRSIKAVEAGVITKLYVERGDNIMAGALIADILDRDHMKLTVPFHSVDASGFYTGQTATVTVDGTMESLTGTVDSIAATDSVGAGGALVRNVTVLVNNPGALSNLSSGTASVGSAVCASGAAFEYAASKQVFAKATGELETLSVKEGDKVLKDQVIGVIAETDLETQIANAYDAVEGAQVNLENARLSLEQLQDRLEDYSITSPIDGTVIEKNYEAGDKIDTTTASTAGVTYPAVIYDMSYLTFDMTIDERDISNIRVGQTVEITADALDGKSFTGTVDKVNINGSTVNGKTTYPVTVLVDGSPTDLYPGMNVSAKIIVEKAGRVLCIPVDYVTRGNFVLVALPGAMDENGIVTDRSKIEERQVTLGRSNEEYIEILGGLEEGETVLLENHASNMMAAMMGM